MKPTKLCLTSQISLYRSRNLRKLNGAAATEVSANNVAEVICQTLARAVDVARITVKSVATCADSVAGRSEEEATGRNTTPDEVNASKFDLDNALRAFAKLKDADTCFQSTQRATYATVASNRNVRWPREARGACPAGLNAPANRRSRPEERKQPSCSNYPCALARVQQRGFSNSADANRKMNQNAVPSGRLSRSATIAGLVINVASATAKQAVQRLMQGEYHNVLKESVSSEENVKLLVDCLCKMRGTALKFGQLLSLQYGILPERVRKAFVSVRHMADIMPEEQVKQILNRELGETWPQMFQTFDLTPMASASLGQVHHAVTNDGTRVCVKVQFPGVAESIDSDVANLIFLCTRTNLVPKNFFLKQFAKELKVELASECDYHNEASFYNIFRQLRLEGFAVPRVVAELSTKRVITTEFVPGVPVEDCRHLPQHVRDSIGDRLLKLSLSELFIFGLMNTDPNPSNYLYDEGTDLIGLIDFGSCRSFNPAFVAEYFKLVNASVEEDVEQIRSLSRSLGFLHPDDSEEMVQHHVESVLITGKPFRHHGRFDFGQYDIMRQVGVCDY